MNICKIFLCICEKSKSQVHTCMFKHCH